MENTSLTDAQFRAAVRKEALQLLDELLDAIPPTGAYIKANLKTALRKVRND